MPPWQKSWDAATVSNLAVPFNPASNNSCRGENAIYLMASAIQRIRRTSLDDLQASCGQRLASPGRRKRNADRVLGERVEGKDDNGLAAGDGSDHEKTGRQTDFSRRARNPPQSGAPRLIRKFVDQDSPRRPRMRFSAPLTTRRGRAVPSRWERDNRLRSRLLRHPEAMVHESGQAVGHFRSTDGTLRIHDHEAGIDYPVALDATAQIPAANGLEQPPRNGAEKALRAAEELARKHLGSEARCTCRHHGRRHLSRVRPEYRFDM